MENLQNLKILLIIKKKNKNINIYINIYKYIYIKIIIYININILYILYNIILYYIYGKNFTERVRILHCCLPVSV